MHTNVVSGKNHPDVLLYTCLVVSEGQITIKRYYDDMSSFIVVKILKKHFLLLISFEGCSDS